MRRITAALILAFVAGLGAACGGDADETAEGATRRGTGASASPSASPSVDVKADTERVCTSVVAAFNNQKIELLESFLKMATEDDPAAKEQARTEANAVIQRLKTAVDAATANAADPKVKAAMQELITTLLTMLKPESLDDPDFDTKMDKAMEEAATYCPGLKA